MMRTVSSAFMLVLLITLGGCSTPVDKTIVAADPERPFQCERDGREYDCISKKELERLVEAEKYWQNNMR